MNVRNRPVEETKVLLRASSRYLKEPTPENERAFLRALQALEATERAMGMTPLPVSRSPFRRNPLSAIAAVIAFLLVGISALVGIPYFLSQLSATPTLTPTATPNPTLIATATTTLAPLTSLTPQPCPAGMIYVAAGEFRMGAAPEDPDAKANEKATGDIPQRLITLAAFCIDRTEVSYAQFTEFSRATDRVFPDPPNQTVDPSASINDLPVVNVSWEEALAYCEYQGKTLPTEAQWEKAARGLSQYIYPWGNDWDADKANSARSLPTGLRPIETYPNGASPYGALNMAGNVSEWVRDWFQSNYYDPDKMPAADPQGPDSSPTLQRIVRGGSFIDTPANLRTTARRGASPAQQQPKGYPDVGFRCAVSSS